MSSAAELLGFATEVSTNEYTAVSAVSNIQKVLGKCFVELPGEEELFIPVNGTELH